MANNNLQTLHNIIVTLSKFDSSFIKEKLNHIWSTSSKVALRCCIKRMNQIFKENHQKTKSMTEIIDETLDKQAK
jgi:hypothetical protein